MSKKVPIKPKDGSTPKEPEPVDVPIAPTGDPLPV